MNTEAIIQLIQQQLPDSKVDIEGDGYHYQALIISNEFIGKNSLQRQQLVYKALNQAITSGDLHAISLKTYSPSEWEEQSKKG